LKTTINNDAKLLLEITRKQPLALSKFLFSGRRQSTHLRHLDMDLSFPKPVIGKVALPTPCIHSIQISEWQHPHGERTVDFSSQTALPTNYIHLELLAALVKNTQDRMPLQATRQELPEPIQG